MYLKMPCVVVLLVKEQCFSNCKHTSKKSYSSPFWLVITVFEVVSEAEPFLKCSLGV